MWTSQDTVGFIILAGFCVHIGFSFEGERGIGGGGGGSLVKAVRLSVGFCWEPRSMKSALPPCMLK